MGHTLVACRNIQTFIGAGGRAAITTGSVAIITLLPSTNCIIATTACRHAHGIINVKLPRPHQSYAM